MIVSTAHHNSKKEIRSYGAWCLTIALVAPFIFFGTVVIKLDLLSQDYRPLTVGVFAFLCALTSSLVNSCFFALMLRPAIRRLLKNTASWRRDKAIDQNGLD